MTGSADDVRNAMAEFSALLDNAKHGSEAVLWPDAGDRECKNSKVPKEITDATKEMMHPCTRHLTQVPNLH